MREGARPGDRVPVSTDGPEGDALLVDARALLDGHGQDQIVIVTWSARTGQTRVTTCGRSTDDAMAAVRAGDLVKRALGWPREYRGQLPARAIAAGRLLCEACEEREQEMDENPGRGRGTT